MPNLTVRQNQTILCEFHWDSDSVIIGRGGASDIDLSCFADLTVSREHAEISRVGQGFEIEDRGAKNGISINGQPANRHLLKDGDLVDIGNVQLTYAERPSSAVARSRNTTPVSIAADGINLSETIAKSFHAADADLPSLRQSHERLIKMYEVVRRLYEADSLESVLATITEVSCALTNGLRGYTAVFDDYPNVTAAAARNMAIDADVAAWPLSQTLIESVIEQHSPVRIEDATRHASFGLAESVQQFHIRSALSCPIIRDGKVIGLIYVDHTRQPGVFTDHDVDLIQALSFQAAAAIDISSRRQSLVAANAQLQRENKRLNTAKNRLIRGSSKAIGDVLDRVENLLAMPRSAKLTVLITGPTGVGKELVAQQIHQEGPRRDGPFLPINCAAFPPSLVESELFGVAAGVATGVDARAGLFEQADGGVLFLDEIAEMPIALQAKLLRVLQEQKVCRVGSSKPITVDAWIIAATNRDLQDEIEAKQFREDLYYRLRMIEIAVPSLHDRKEDIDELAEHFFTKYCREFGKSIYTIADDAMAALRRYTWPGNVRELANCIAGAVALSRHDQLLLTDLPAQILDAPAPANPAGVNRAIDTSPRTLEDAERELLINTLERTGWNITEASRQLGIGRQAVYQRIEKFNLIKP